MAPPAEPAARDILGCATGQYGVAERRNFSKQAAVAALSNSGKPLN
jgi:hypothetical protein